MLKENTLFGTRDKVEIAIARIREFEPDEGYYLAFSGGKDSQCIYHLSAEAGVKFDAHYNVTTVDPPEIVRFIHENYPDVKFEKPKKTMWQLISGKLIPPTRRIRYCCEELKERGGSGRIVMTGIRSAESTNRTKRHMVEACYKDRHKTYVHPIIDWSEADVWEFIGSRKLKYCELYDEGYKRIGCVMCPLQRRDGMLRDMVRYPRIAQCYYKAFGNLLKYRESRGKETEWRTPADVMEWWIYGKENNDVNIDPNQISIFE